jgi:superfamily II DNA or RNA helicase
VAKRLIAKYERLLAPNAVHITAPMPVRQPLDATRTSPFVRDFVRRYEPRAETEGLYPHQARILGALVDGSHDVVLTSSTGTGKSLCFWSWVFDGLERDESATALVCFPTQALMWGQAERLARISVAIEQRDELAFAGAVEIEGRSIPWTVWKGTGQGETVDEAMAVHVRSEAFGHARIRIATLDKAHVSLLSDSDPFARRLALVVVDEVHSFQGLMGANVHFFLKRMYAYKEGLDKPRPRVFLASATLADPEEFSRRLGSFDPGGRLLAVSDGVPTSRTSVPLERVGDLLEPHVPSALERVVLFVDDPDEEARVADIFDDDGLLGSEVNAIYFSSNKFESRRLRLRVSSDGPDARDAIVYDGSLPPPERRRVERSFNSGTPRGLSLIATSALEVGVDIDALDLCVMDDLPFSRAQLLQRIGRVGRRAGRPGLALLRAGASPNDRALVEAGGGGFVIDAARSPPLPVHLEMVRWRHAIACHDELLRVGVREAARRALIEKHFAVTETAEELSASYRTRFGAIVDMEEPAWVYKGFRASASQKKIPVIELDGFDEQGRPRARFDGSRRADIAWLDDAYVFRDAHPEAVLLGADGKRWRVRAYHGRWDVARWVHPESDVILGKWLRSLECIYVERVEHRVATQGAFVDSTRMFSSLVPPAGARPPRGGTFTFGVWDFSRKWNGY